MNTTVNGDIMGCYRSIVANYQSSTSDPGAEDKEIRRQILTQIAT